MTRVFPALHEGHASVQPPVAFAGRAPLLPAGSRHGWWSGARTLCAYGAFALSFAFTGAVIIGVIH